jgi:hypothetical protein
VVEVPDATDPLVLADPDSSPELPEPLELGDRRGPDVPLSSRPREPWP